MREALVIRPSSKEDFKYCNKISQMYSESSKQRGTGIAIRRPHYIREKMIEGKGVIGFVNSELAGFCYIETFSKGTYVSNSGLIVSDKFRNMGIGKKIKKVIFEMARDKYPSAKVFGITTSNAVMRINSDLGYRPVSFSELTNDEDFWKGCHSCPNYDILQRNDKKLCLCTGMLAPSKEEVLAYDLSNLVLNPSNK